ncbi:MAG: hypothetical protein ACI9SC_001148, partial [Gammaproteobacteria bacterium]
KADAAHQLYILNIFFEHSVREPTSHLVPSLRVGMHTSLKDEYYVR